MDFGREPSIVILSDTVHRQKNLFGRVLAARTKNLDESSKTRPKNDATLAGLRAAGAQVWGSALFSSAKQVGGPASRGILVFYVETVGRELRFVPPEKLQE